MNGLMFSFYLHFNSDNMLRIKRTIMFLRYFSLNYVSVFFGFYIIDKHKLYYVV